MDPTTDVLYVPLNTRVAIIGMEVDGDPLIGTVRMHRTKGWTRNGVLTSIGLNFYHPSELEIMPTEGFTVGTHVKVKSHKSVLSRLLNGLVGEITDFTKEGYYVVKLPNRERPVWFLSVELEPVKKEEVKQVTFETLFFYGHGTTIRTFHSNNGLFYTTVQNNLYSQTALVAGRADNEASARKIHEYWIQRMCKPELPQYILELTPTREVVHWRTNLSETSKPVTEAVQEALALRKEEKAVTHHTELKAIPTEFSKDFLLLKGFGLSK